MHGSRGQLQNVSSLRQTHSHLAKQKQGGNYKKNKTKKKTLRCPKILEVDIDMLIFSGYLGTDQDCKYSQQEDCNSDIKMYSTVFT